MIEGEKKGEGRGEDGRKNLKVSSAKSIKEVGAKRGILGEDCGSVRFRSTGRKKGGPKEARQERVQESLEG